MKPTQEESTAKRLANIKCFEKEKVKAPFTKLAVFGYIAPYTGKVLIIELCVASVC